MHLHCCIGLGGTGAGDGLKDEHSLYTTRGAISLCSSQQSKGTITRVHCRTSLVTIRRVLIHSFSCLTSDDDDDDDDDDSWWWCLFWESRDGYPIGDLHRKGVGAEGQNNNNTAIVSFSPEHTKQKRKNQTHGKCSSRRISPLFCPQLSLRKE